MVRCSIACCLMGWALAAPAVAQPKVELPPAKDGKLANLTRVMVPEAKSVGLSDAHGLLAFCHEKTVTHAHVSLVKLDAKGNPSPAPTSWTIAHAKGLVKHPNYALSVAFHPKLPLLYVWQDMDMNFTTPPAPLPPETNTFDHLTIYNIAKETPELVASLCRGPEYGYGFLGGQLALDPSGEYLYVPNLWELKNRWFLLGRFKLDADGLPFLGEAEAKLPAPARAKRLMELNAAKPLVPPQIIPYDNVYLFPINAWGSGHSFLPVGKDAVITSSYYGTLSWRPAEKLDQVHGLPLVTRTLHLLGGHPKLPVLFATGADTESFSCLHQVEGYLTLMPRLYKFPDTKLYSNPVVLPKTNQLAVGGQHHVYVFNLDDKGVPAAEAVKVRVFNPMVKTLVYSERFDRLYVGVELSK